jgi:hypothetical protein
MNDEQKVLEIFQSISTEFESFRKRMPSGKILEFFNEQNIEAKFAKSKSGFQTIGVFKNKKVSGLAFVIYGPTDFFFGEFVDSRRNGRGYRLYSNGFMFKGEYANDKKVDGIVCEFSTGSEIYNGEWFNDNYHGHGTLRNPFNKSVYQGQFINGLFDGQGKILWSTGDYYEGEFRQGRQEGKGVFVLIGLGKFKGFFKGGIFLNKDPNLTILMNDNPENRPQNSIIREEGSDISQIIQQRSGRRIDTREPVASSHHERVLEFNF